ncbi:MAG: hypothetical protein ACLGHN_14230 [Bacteriovoracia bacterium]
MRVISTSKWDETFFQQFLEFKNLIHKDIITSFPEKIEDYSRFFSPDSPFAQDYVWQGFMVLKDNKVIAKAILAWRKEASVGNLGFLDWENNVEAAELLIKSVVEAGKSSGITNIKTPVDLNFYVKYRIRLPGGGKPFWGEPVYPDYYHDLFFKTGFNEIGRWDTYQISKLQGIVDYFMKRVKLSKKPEGSHSKTRDKSLRTTVRCIRMDDWDNELKRIYSLFTEAYKSMPEWEPISFDQFKIVYDDFKYIINPLYAYLVELRGKPVGFSINFADPLPVLSKVKGKSLSSLEKALLFLKLRTNLSCFLIAHVGKIPGPNGEEIKGVQIQVSKRIQFFAATMRKVLVTFQMKDSPSRRSFDEKYQRPYAQYVLYGRNLE